MWFWWFILICDLLIPVIMVVIGIWMVKKPPKTINHLVGYRTTRSMINIDTWTFAQTHCGRTWIKVGWPLLGISIVPHLCMLKSSQDALSIMSIIIMVVQLIVLIASIFPTERALKNTFHEDGTRK